MVAIKMRFFNFLLFVILLLACHTEKVRASDAHISISPKSCMAQDGWCKTNLKIHWQLAKPLDVCLKLSDRKRLLCFEADKKPSATVAININQKLTIELLPAKSKKALASATLNVFVKENQKRRRQRHAWSVIL